MFILDILLKKIFPQKLGSEYNYDPLRVIEEDDDDEEEKCSHEFMPVDSTGETLACIKCGFIVQHKGNK